MISDLILILMFVSIVCLVVGLVRPAVFSRFVKNGMTRKKALLIFGGIAIVSFIVFGATSSPTPAPTSQNNNSQKLASTSNEKKIDYQIIQSWTIPNGGHGKTLLIPKEYLNDADMTALGNKIKKDVSSDRNSFIEIYTDRQAEALRTKVLGGKATKEEEDLYDKNYVGTYTKNANTGYHEFIIFFDGLAGTNEKKIEY
jgi:hypothetical protein